MLVILARRRAAHIERAVRERLPVGSDGVISGAEALDLRRGGPDRPAVLLLHGGGDTPQTLRYLAERLYERGYDVRVPLLPGHGRTPRDFAAVDQDAWLEAALAEYGALGAGHRWTAVVGLSMGGALAAALAAGDEELGAVVLLAPYLSMPRLIQGAAITAPLWGAVIPFVNAIDARARPSIHDPVERARSLAYGLFTPRALRALRHTVRRGVEALPRIMAPTLMIQSREDNRISVAAGQRTFDHIGARRKQLVWTDEGGHVITVDRGRESVISAVLAWLDACREDADHAPRAKRESMG